MSRQLPHDRDLETAVMLAPGQWTLTSCDAAPGGVAGNPECPSSRRRHLASLFGGMITHSLKKEIWYGEDHRQRVTKAGSRSPSQETAPDQRRIDDFANTLPLGATLQYKLPLCGYPFTEDAARKQLAPGLDNSCGACLAPCGGRVLLQPPSPHAACAYIAQDVRRICMNKCSPSPCAP